jgi:hypothetical protein
MNTWTEAAIRGGNFAKKRLERRGEIYNKWNYEMEEIKIKKYYTGDNYKLRLDEWAKIKPKIVEFFRLTNKV